jgi:hypothetical protein
MHASAAPWPGGEMGWMGFPPSVARGWRLGDRGRPPDARIAVQAERTALAIDNHCKSARSVKPTYTANLELRSSTIAGMRGTLVGD